MLTAAVSVISILLCLCSLSTAQLDLKTCGDEDSVVTCPFFFSKVNDAFRQPNVLYTLRKAFFPTDGKPPVIFGVEMTLDIENSTNIACKDEDYLFGNVSVDTPPTMDEVCSYYECVPLQFGWEHEWSKTVISYIIKREDLDLLQATNFNSYVAATFKTFDLVLENLARLQENGTNSTSLGVTREDTVQFHLVIPELPCQPDKNVLRDAWEDILPWVSPLCQSLCTSELFSTKAKTASSDLKSQGH